jgi:biotin transport system substrate-specific component
MSTVIAPSATSPSLRESAAQTFTRKVAIVVGASLFVAVAAHLSVPLPFTPVPLTLGDLAVLLVGLALSPLAALAALALYLAEGVSGLPFFSPTGPGGIAQLFGPTGGYLLAYPLAAGMVSYLTKFLGRRMSAFAAAAVACTAATALILSSGVAWISLAPHVGLAHAFTLGALPFLPGGAIKIVAAAGIYATLKTRKA